MRFVLDQGVPRDAAARFRELGYECVHVGDVEMWNAEDHEILAWAGTDAVVVTLDADFHTMVAVSGATGPSVIRVRIQGLRAGAIVEVLRRVLADFEDDLKRGCLITVKSRGHLSSSADWAG